MNTLLHHGQSLVKSRVRRALLLGAVVFEAFVSPEDGACASDAAVEGLWDYFARADGAAGYRDNVLRSGLSVEHSAFVQSTLEALLTRFWPSGAHVSSTMLAESTWYFDAPSVDHEQFLSAMLTGGLGLGTASERKAAVSYLYQKQVLDVSETEADLRRVLIEGHNFSFEPSWKAGLGYGWFLELGAAGSRQDYLTELDDYWESAGRLAVSRTYASRSQIGVGYDYRWRPYDTRNQTDGDGYVVLGTSLAYAQHEVAINWRHYWDADRRWRTTAKLSGMFNRDNGSGYFDYDRAQFRTSLRWLDRGWDIGCVARASHYSYHRQNLGGTQRYRHMVVLEISVEKSVTKHWLVKLSAQREWDMSNDPIDDFSDWACWAGFGYEF